MGVDGIMPTLPESWNLKTKKRDDGKLDIIGKDDLGGEYKVRTTDAAEITERDVQELKDADRESYRDRDKGAREFCNKLVAHGKSRSDADEGAFVDDLMEAAGPVVHAGLEREGTSVNFQRIPQWRWDLAFGKEEN
jgi:hypothetical protein